MTERSIARDAAEAWHGRVIEMIESGDVMGAVDLYERHLREAPTSRWNGMLFRPGVCHLVR